MCATTAPRFQHCSGSGFPLPCLKRCIPYSCGVHPQEPLGLPKCFDASLPACHGLRTPADLHRLAPADSLVSPSVCVKTLGVRTEPLRSCPSTAEPAPDVIRGGAVPPAAYRIRCRRFAPLVRRVYHRDSAMDARLATGGWLALTRQGLSPCKRRQALLGARTLGVRRG
jgi:hypothetical protein